ncbi:MAG: anhydro-N-acetylmuramic acid kinase [Acidobacteriaceae bacterium]
MLVAGVMSGTSADGVDVAICRISPAVRAGGTPRLKVLGHRAFPYSAAMRAAVLAAMDAKRTSAAEMSRLNWRLGEIYAECVAATAAQLKLKPQLVACHGQTIYHQATSTKYLGADVRCTWQIGEASVIAERLLVPVVSDFRPADLAAGGQGAPLVSMLDYCMFRHATKNRLLLNLGGIANVTALPAGCDVDGVLAFDTGPANMVIDAAMQKLYGRAFDRDGSTASRGHMLDAVVTKFMNGNYFLAPPPKSCGREEFGAAFVARFLAACEREGARRKDVIATATAFTSAIILDAYARFCRPHFEQRAPLACATEMLVAGGGARNATLMHALREGFAALGVDVLPMQSVGLAVEAKEAAAFALLSWLTWHGLPGNVPSATGAIRAVVLGRVTHGA